MNKINYVNLVSFTFLLFTFLSCKKDDDIKAAAAATSTSLEEISDIVTFHGNRKGDIIIVNTQGGPSTQLEDETLNEFIIYSKTESALFVNVHQAQTKNPSEFTTKDISFEQAKQHDLQSIKYLKRVIDFFKSQEGKTVYVLGISFGAFMTQELIASHGVDVADGYFIMVGRLDIDEGTWQPFSQGKYTEYVYDDNGTYSINILGDGFDFEERNMARLAAGLGYNRYTEKLNSISDLSKITYVWGDRDQQVGPLSTSEIQFLNSKGANVILSEGGDHNSTVDTGLNLLKQKFGIQ